MNKKSYIVIPLVLMFFFPMYLQAQQTVQQDEEMSADAFSNLIKTEWIYLRDAVDEVNVEIGRRGEFETTPEFQARAIRIRQGFIDKLSKHIKEMKLDRKTFGVWFKAILDSYDADKEIYSLKSPTTIESPYDLPTVECIIPENPYVELADSIKGGYRISYIRLKFDPAFIWKAARSDAIDAKNKEHDMYFKVRFVLEEDFDNALAKAVLRIIPKEIALIHQQSKYVYWKETIK